MSGVPPFQLSNQVTDFKETSYKYFTNETHLDVIFSLLNLLNNNMADVRSSKVRSKIHEFRSGKTQTSSLLVCGEKVYIKLFSHSE